MSGKTMAVIFLAAAAASSNRGDALTDHPLHPSAWGDPVAMFSGLGTNGLIVDPYVLTHEVNSAGCLVAFVPLAEVVARCGDDDGCTLRLVSDTNSGRDIGAPRAFVTAADGLTWTVTTGFSTTTSGTNGNMTVTEIFEISSNNCTVWDDFQTPGTDYELRVCNTRSCTLRIDD